MVSPRSDNGSSMIVPAPAHPVPQLQGPFEESMMESVNDLADQEANLDSITRRTILLERPQYERVVAGRWKQKPGERYHPLWKVVSQISFGLHLLAEGMARSEEEVMKILQTHVDDIDCFLERTTEDMDLAQSDVSERLHYLKLPLQHVQVFDRMLEDRVFRASIVEGNEKIEHIIERTSEATKDALKDVQKGLDATKALGRYLSELEKNWKRTSPEHEAVFVAMLGNVEGWGRAFMDLHLQGNKLAKSLVRLLEIVTEMQRRAGVVSRKLLTQSRQSHRSSAFTSESRPASNGNRIYRGSDVRRPPSALTISTVVPHKPLPADPNNRNSRPATQRAYSSDTKGYSSSNQASMSTSGSSKSPHPSFRNSPSHPTNTQTDVSGDARPVLKHVSTSQPIRRTPLSEFPDNTNPMEVQVVSPVELPAEVPQEALLQAPLSKKSRISMHLALKPRDSDDQKVVHRLSAKGLVSVLKSPLSPGIMTTPNSDISGATDPSYSTAFTSDGDRDITHSAPQDTHVAEWTATTDNVNEEQANTNDPRLLAVSAPLSPESAISKGASPSTSRSPAFTSHPPDMLMATGPDFASVSTQIHSDMQAKEAEGQQHEVDSRDSELGEPGPEIETLKSSDKSATTSVKSTNMQQLGEPTPPLNAAPIPSRSAIGDSDDVTPQMEHREIFANSSHEVSTERLHDDQAVAELEGVTPLASKSELSGPVELEAPQHYFSLPPRPLLSAGAACQKADEASATISSQADFFKLPPSLPVQSPDSDLTEQITTKAGHTSLPSVDRKHRISASQEARSIMPVGLQIHRKEAPRKSKLHTTVIEQISFTPPGSPIHARALSEMSANSAQLSIDRRSRIYAPSDEAPPPPPPGGRRMASIDYASAAQFDGERKTRHNSTGSTNGWKKFLSGKSSPLSEMGNVIPPKAAEEQSSDKSTVDLMTAAGKDVLWFKGMSSNGVWVS